MGRPSDPIENAPQYTIQNTYQLNDDLQHGIKGQHSLKFGFDGFSWISPSVIRAAVAAAIMSTSYLSDYMFDYYPDYIAQRSLGGQEYSGNQYLYGYLRQRFLEAAPNLTVNIGLR